MVSEMKTTMSAIILIVLTSCQRPLEDNILVFPTGRYTGFTHYDLIYMAIKLEDGRLAVDGNYDFDSRNFTASGFEKATEYPAIAEFLGKTFDEYRLLSENIDMSNCNKLTPVYVVHANTQTTDLIRIPTIAECIDGDRPPRIENELWTLRQKYVR